VKNYKRSLQKNAANKLQAAKTMMAQGGFQGQTYGPPPATMQSR
jgi:hypothetical protein